LTADGVAPVTVLGFLRRELAFASEHQVRVATEWDRTLGMLRGLDFRALVPGEGLAALRGEVEIWNDLTLEPPRRLAAHPELGGLPLEEGERMEYLHRVLVGMEPAAYMAMCDEVESEMDLVAESEGPVSMPQLRDRVVELMEVGVRTSVRSIEWLRHRYRDVDLSR